MAELKLQISYSTAELGPAIMDAITDIQETIQEINAGGFKSQVNISAIHLTFSSASEIDYKKESEIRETIAAALGENFTVYQIKPQSPSEPICPQQME